jgi:hypothetical protein
LNEDAVTDRQPSFWGLVPLVYQDLSRVLKLMLPAVLTLTAAIVVTSFVGGFASGLIGTRIGKAVLGVLVQAAMFWAISPYLIALYRGVANNEITNRPESLRRTPEGQRFAAWQVLLTVISSAPVALYGALGLNVTADPTVEPPLMPLMLVFFISLFVWVFTVRSTTLLPQLALDPEQASLARSFEESRGRFWYIVGVQIVTMGPLVLGGLAVTSIIAGSLGPLGSVLLVPMTAAVTGLTVVLTTAVGTRLYQRFSIA